MVGMVKDLDALVAETHQIIKAYWLLHYAHSVQIGINILVLYQVYDYRSIAPMGPFDLCSPLLPYFIRQERCPMTAHRIPEVGGVVVVELIMILQHGISYKKGLVCSPNNFTIITQSHNHTITFNSYPLLVLPNLNLQESQYAFLNHRPCNPSSPGSQVSILFVNGMNPSVYPANLTQPLQRARRR